MSRIRPSVPAPTYFRASDTRLWPVLMLSLLMLTTLGLVPVAWGAIGSATSPAIPVDAQDPSLVLDPIADNTIFFTEQVVPLHWTAFDHNPGDTADHFEASVIIDSNVVETIFWYPDITEFTWEYTMPAIQSANCRFEVKAVDTFGNTGIGVSNNFTILFSTSGSTPALPAKLSLSAPSPNPFNPATVVNFSAPAGSQIALAVYDARGRKVRTLAQAAGGSGLITARWDGLDNNGRSQPGGVYFFVLDAQTPDGPRRLTRKAMLIP